MDSVVIGEGGPETLTGIKTLKFANVSQTTTPASYYSAVGATTGTLTASSGTH